MSWVLGPVLMLLLVVAVTYGIICAGRLLTDAEHAGVFVKIVGWTVILGVLSLFGAGVVMVAHETFVDVFGSRYG